MKNNKFGAVLILLGTASIIAALALFFFNEKEAESAYEQSMKILEVMEAEKIVLNDLPTDGQAVEGEKTLEIDGLEYIGYIEIPAIEIKLPVMSEWDYDKLKTAPCRQFGSHLTDDLVIAAHNYKKHFGGLSELAVGDAVMFTDMSGETTVYSVAQTAILEPTAVEEVQNSGFDLVLYTCTYAGKSRVTVFCERKR